MRVAVLQNENGTFRGKFHRPDAYDCAGRRMHEEKHPDVADYVLVDITQLPPSHEACQFECCFKEWEDAAAVASHLTQGRSRLPRSEPGAYPTEHARPGVVAVGSRVRVLDEGSGGERTFTLVGANRRNGAADELPADSPVGRALMGAVVGETVTAETPRGHRRYTLLAVEP